MPDTFHSWVSDDLVPWLRRNAVVLGPLALTVYEATDGLSVKDAIPVVIGIVLRQFFTSPTHEVEDREAVAYREGLFMADVSKAARQARLDAEADLPPLEPPAYPAEGDDVPPF